MSNWARAKMNFDRNLDHDEIDDFLQHIKSSTQKSLKKLEEKAKNLSAEEFEYPEQIHEYRDFLMEDAITTENAMTLADQLSIIALYKKVESQTTRVIAEKIQNAASKNLSDIKKLEAVLPFKLESLKGYNSFNELRLLNNSIKHGGLVSLALSRANPNWQVKTTITSTNDSYMRLLPGVKDYVFDLVTQVYQNPSPIK